MKKLTAVLLSTALLHSLNVLTMSTPDEPVKQQQRKKVATVPTPTPESTPVTALSPQPNPTQLLNATQTGDAQQKPTEGQPVLQPTVTGATTVATVQVKKEEKQEETVEYKKGWIQWGWEALFSPNGVKNTLGLLTTNETIPNKQRTQIKHDFDWAVNDIAKKTEAEAAKHDVKTIIGLQSTLTNDETQIKSLQKLLELAKKRKVLIDEETLNKAYKILANEDQYDLQYLTLVFEEVSKRMQSRKATRSEIQSTKLLDDLGYVSDDDYTKPLTVLQKIQKIKYLAKAEQKAI